MTDYYLCTSLKDIDIADSSKRRVLIWADGHRLVVGNCTETIVDGPYRYIVENVENMDLTMLILLGVSVIKLERNPYADVKPLCTYLGKVVAFTNIPHDVIRESCMHVNWSWETFA